jgi:hypothetical protein
VVCILWSFGIRYAKATSNTNSATSVLDCDSQMCRPVLHIRRPQFYLISLYNQFQDIKKAHRATASVPQPNSIYSIGRCLKGTLVSMHVNNLTLMTEGVVNVAKLRKPVRISATVKLHYVSNVCAALSEFEVIFW